MAYLSSLDRQVVGILRSASSELRATLVPGRLRCMEASLCNLDKDLQEAFSLCD
jgi:hypothetical protein